MKKILLLLFICLPIALFAQTDAKYLEGGVPIVDGKVTFTSKISIPGMSQKQIYETLLQWANKRYQPDDKFNDRILFQNPEEGDIVIGGEEYLTFSKSSFALDRTRIYYQMRISCQTGKCDINISRIRYWYNEARDGGEKFTAEEWIVDKVAMHKSKTKLYPVSGKFRIKTIDLKDELLGEIRSTLGNHMLESGAQVAQTAPVPPTNETIAKQAEPVQASQPLVPLQPAQIISPDNNETFIAQATRMTITAGNDEQFEISKECWGGFGDFFSKKVAYLLIDTQKTMGNMLMLQSESFKISFYSSNSNQPPLVIHCKKLMTQNINGEEAQKMSPNCVASKSYNMYVGEILK